MNFAGSEQKISTTVNPSAPDWTFKKKSQQIGVQVEMREIWLILCCFVVLGCTPDHKEPHVVMQEQRRCQMSANSGHVNLFLSTSEWLNGAEEYTDFQLSEGHARLEGRFLGAQWKGISSISKLRQLAFDRVAEDRYLMSSDYDDKHLMSAVSKRGWDVWKMGYVTLECAQLFNAFAPGLVVINPKRTP